MSRRKYTREVLTAAVLDADSVTDVLRALDLPIAGGTHALISRRLREYQIDTSHFTRRRRQLELTTRGDPLELLRRRPPGSPRVNGERLRVAMAKAGVDPLCTNCSLGPSWNGAPLQLQVDHVDGDPLNNSIENLRYLCPNCHSQCPTFSRRRSARGAEAGDA